MKDSSRQDKGGSGTDQVDGDLLDIFPPILDEELLNFIRQIPGDVTHDEFCTVVALIEKTPLPTVKSTTEAPSIDQTTTNGKPPQKRRKKQVCHRNMDDPDVDKERKAGELLKQWASNKLFEPKYVRKGKNYNNPCRWYEKLFQVCKQDPKLPDRLTIGDLHGEAACTGLWLELIYLMRNIAIAKETPGAEHLGGWTKNVAALKKYGFNVEVIEATLQHLVFMRTIQACNTRDIVQKSIKVKEQHTALVKD